MKEERSNGGGRGRVGGGKEGRGGKGIGKGDEEEDGGGDGRGIFSQPERHANLMDRLDISKSAYIMVKFTVVRALRAKS